ncbi:MAG: tRNA (adenosine(37)-N6)-threonylcarbamoyltransferase complex dimerization subunit type 1 TsaB [Thalassotalea sp.]
MKYLAIDASTEACSVALKIDDKVYSRFELCPQSHSLVLLPMIDEILKEANITLQALDGLIFGQGPGSFTGVRIGVGVAQGLAFSANLTVVGVSTLQAMAQVAYEKSGHTAVLSVIDARMSEVYSGFYQLNEQGIMQAQGEETVMAPALIVEHYRQFGDKFYAAGTGWDAYTESLQPLKQQAEPVETLFPDASAMLTIGIAGFQQGQGVSAEMAQPVYVRDTVSWKKLPGRE